MISLDSINPHVRSPLANKTNSNSTNKTNTNKFSDNLQDAYVASEKSEKIDSTPDTYSKLAQKVSTIKEVEEKGFTEDEYCEFCVLFYNLTKDGSREPVYFPPPNASDEIKRAWIDTMKSSSKEEQTLVKNAIADVVTAVFDKYPHVTTEMYQNFLNNQSSYKEFLNLFLKGLKNSKSRECSQIMRKVLKEFKEFYKMYTDVK